MSIVNLYERAAATAHMYLYILNNCSEFKPDTIRNFLNFHFQYLDEPVLDESADESAYWEWKRIHEAWGKFHKEFRALFERYTRLG